MLFRFPLAKCLCIRRIPFGPSAQNLTSSLSSVLFLLIDTSSNPISTSLIVSLCPFKVVEMKWDMACGIRAQVWNGFLWPIQTNTSQSDATFLSYFSLNITEKSTTVSWATVQWLTEAGVTIWSLQHFYQFCWKSHWIIILWHMHCREKNDWKLERSLYPRHYQHLNYWRL